MSHINDPAFARIMATVPAASPVATVRASVDFDGSSWIARLADEQDRPQWASRPCGSFGAAVVELQLFTGKVVSVAVGVAP